MNFAALCDICGMAFINKRRLNQHIDLVHKRSLFQCQSCNKVFKDKTEFNKHMNIHFRILNTSVSGSK
jgi:uncharacterized C2H2 Zn-finger protein